MAKDSAAEVLTKLPPPNGWQGWPTGIQAAVKLEISVRRLRILVQTGNITCYQCPDRTNRYDPDQLERLARDLRVVSKRNLDDEGEEGGNELDDLEEDKAGKQAVNESVNKTLVEALRNANAMVLEMHKLLSSGSRNQAETQDKVIVRLLEREESREKTISEVYLAREALFNQQTERDLAVRKAANVESRRAEMWTLTKGHLDKLVDVAFAKFGIPKEVMAKLEPAIMLLQKLNPMQLQMLIGSGFLTKDQEELVRQIVAEVPPDEDVSEKVAAECSAILQKQAAEKKSAQAAQDAEAARAAQAIPPQPAKPIVGEIIDAPATAQATPANDSVTQPGSEPDERK